MKISCCRLLLLMLLLWIYSDSTTYAQISTVISSVNHSDPVEGMPVDMQVEFFQPGTVSALSIFYRGFGETEYREREMALLSGSASVTIPAEAIKAPMLEYYFAYTMRDGTFETYPYNLPYRGNPLQLQIRTPSPKDKEIFVLSPESGETVELRSLFISISLLKASDEVAKEKTKLYLNNNDITDYLLIADDMILFYNDNFPGNAGLGRQFLKIELYDKEGNLYHTVNHVFITYSSDEDISPANNILYNLQLKGESRREDSYGSQRWYNSIDISGDAEYKGFRLEGRTYITSEESDNRQPYNRFYAGLMHRYFALKAGDVYPSMPSLILNGKKVRGFEGILTTDFLSIHTTFGQVRRGIEGELLQVFPEGFDTLATNIIDLDDSTRAAVEFGTYERSIFALRPLFTFSEDVALGFSYLHAEDDMESIEYGKRPLENAVFGADFNVNFDHKNIRFSTQAAFSLYNDDISTGTLTDEEIDDIFGDDGFYSTDPEDAKKLRDIFKTFITFNQFIYPLNPQELSTFAAEGALTLNYFQNNMKASYIYRGNDYHSFGNTFLRKDVAGINLRDRVRLYDNKLFVTLGYEQLQDNLQKTKQSTTTYTTFSGAVSFFPGPDQPSVTAGFTRQQSSNDISLEDSLLADYYIDDATNKFSLQLSYTFDFYAAHRTSFSIMHSARDDNSQYDYDLNSTALYFNANSRWSSKVKTTFNFNFSKSDIAGSEFDYTSITAGIQYDILPDKLNLYGSVAPSFGDLKRVAFDFKTGYSIIHNLSIVFRFRYLKNDNRSDDTIFGITTRYDLR